MSPLGDCSHLLKRIDLGLFHCKGGNCVRKTRWLSWAGPSFLVWVVAVNETSFARPIAGGLMVLRRNVAFTLGR